MSGDRSESESLTTTPPTGVHVTVVITTHNRPTDLPAAIRSVLDQTIDDIEVLVVDDGSEPPASADAFDDERLRLVRRDEAGGPGDARNRGLAEASGTFTMFLDDDDTLDPRFLELSIQAIADSRLEQPVASLSAQQMVGVDGGYEGQRLPLTTERGTNYQTAVQPGRSRLVHPTLVAPTSVLREIGGFDPALRAHEHGDFFIRLSAVCSIQGFDEPVYHYRTPVGPRVSQDRYLIAEALVRFVGQHRDSLGRREAGRKLSSAAFNYLQAGRWWPAIRTSVRGLALRPDRRSIRIAGAALLGPRLSGVDASRS